MTDTLDTQIEEVTATRVTDPRLLTALPAPVVVPVRSTPFRKRVADLAVAIPAAVITLPLVCLLSVISWVKYGQSPFFTQPRLGQGGSEFKFWKIRTLPPTAPEAADKYQLRAVQLPKFAVFLRNHHLDELPQLWLVIAGKMSLVGPRPEMPTLSASFDRDFVADRLSVKPGCTGLWQVSRASRGLIGEDEQWDRWYVEHSTLRFDLWIAYRTMLMMAGLHEIDSLDRIPSWTGASPASH